jgi:ribosomal protein L16 Arg81 hydroxylase
MPTETVRENRIAPGHELATLLAPMGVEAFLTQHLGKTPLFIKGSPEKLAHLFGGPLTKRDFFDAVYETANDPLCPLEISSLRRGVVGEDGKVQQHVSRKIRADEAEAHFAMGANLAVDGLVVPRIGSAVAALKTQLQHAGDAQFTAILSPGGVGFPPHIDSSSQFFVQSEGRKRYRVSAAPVVEWPRGSTVFAQDGGVASSDHALEEWETPPIVDTEHLIEFEMEPGDILYCPPGTIHATEALGAYCVNLVVFFDKVSFLKLATQVFDTLLMSKPEWRHLPNPEYGECPEGELPPSVERFFDERLRELREVLNGLDAKSFLLHSEWKKMLADPGKITTGTLARARMKEPGGTVRPDDLLQLAGMPLTSAKCVTAEGEAVLNVYFGRQELSVRGEWVPFLETLLRTHEFRADESLYWAGKDAPPYPWSTVGEYLEILTDIGILVRKERW